MPRAIRLPKEKGNYKGKLVNSRYIACTVISAYPSLKFKYFGTLGSFSCNMYDESKRTFKRFIYVVVPFRKWFLCKVKLNSWLSFLV